MLVDMMIKEMPVEESATGADSAGADGASRKRRKRIRPVEAVIEAIVDKAIGGDMLAMKQAWSLIEMFDMRKIQTGKPEIKPEIKAGGKTGA
jgi:hypothetical protein